MSADELELAAAVERFVAGLRSSSPVTAREFAARHPALAPELLPALEAAEDLERWTGGAHDEIAEGLQRLGVFRVEGELGRGGMGIVCAAVDEQLGRRVALKLLPRSMLSSPSARARFQREASLAARLHHPGICTVHGAGVTDGQPWIAMRLVEGRSLAEAISSARERGLQTAALTAGPSGSEPRDLARCCASVARALAFAHAQGVIHRDVKPSNVLVEPSGQPVLLDFGVALDSGTDAPSLTRTGETAGTPAYLAPELISGERARPDERCDVYALGITLYECLTLQQPFTAPTRESLYRTILEGTPQDARRRNAQIPRDLAVIVATAIERDPQRRYASANALAQDLEAFVAGREIAARPARAFERALRWARREPRQALLVGALFVAGAGVALAGGMAIAARDQARIGREAQRARAVEEALAEAYSTMGHVSSRAAVSEFDAVLALAPDNEEAKIGVILATLRGGDDRRALELLDDAPRTPAYERLRAIAEHRATTDDDASWLASASAFELFVAGEALRIEGERRPPSEQAQIFGEALARIDEAVVRSPQARAVYHQMRALNASKLGDEATTLSATQALVALWPDSSWSLFQAGSALTKIDPHRALSLLERSAALDPSRASTFQCLGIAHFELGEFEEALVPLRRALALDPQDELAANAIGVAWMRLGCPDEARGAFRDALSLNPFEIGPWANLTLLEPGAAETAAAAAHVLDLDPGQAGHRAIYAQALFEIGDVARARDEFARLIVEDGRKPMVWNAYAMTLASGGELQLALDALGVSRTLQPSQPEIDEFQSQLEAALQAGG